jgi:hypothetical protein
MMVLGGGHFLMSEVPLYPTPHARFGAPRLSSLDYWQRTADGASPHSLARQGTRHVRLLYLFYRT